MMSIQNLSSFILINYLLRCFLTLLYIRNFYCLSIESNSTLLLSNRCNRKYPAKGTWLRNIPYWKEKNCPAKAFDMNSTEHCLFNRTIYIIGISTARQVAFSIMTALGGASINRTQQKSQCPLNDQIWGDSCHQNYRGVRIKFLFFHYMDGFNYINRTGNEGFPFILKNKNNDKGLSYDSIHYNNVNEARHSIGEEELYPSDFCTHKYHNYTINYDKHSLDNTYQCLLNFFQDSKENDVLIFNVGYVYSKVSNIVDVKSWTKDAAKHFKNNIQRTFKGTYVFQITMSQLHDNWESISYLHYNTNFIIYKSFTDVFSSNYNITNHHLDSKIITNNDDNDNHQRWYMIDQWAINEGRAHLYNDRIHYAGPLTDATLQQILNILCPNQGIPIIFPSNLPTADELTGKLMIVKLYDIDSDLSDISYNIETMEHLQDLQNKNHSQYEFYTIDPSGYLHHHNQSSTTHCIDILNNTGLLLITKKVFELFPLHEKGINSNICQESALIKSNSDRVVYHIKNGKKMEFKNAMEFMNLGFSFDNVISIDDWLLNLVP